MSYEKVAQELFEILLGEVVKYDKIEKFNWLCSTYPELLAEYERKVDEEIKDVYIPGMSKQKMQENAKKIIEIVEREKIGIMEKMILGDGTELEIRKGAVLSSITTDVADFSALEALADRFNRKNLKTVRFAAHGDVVVGEYKNVALMKPHFRVTLNDQGLEVTFGIRELTEEEMKIPEVCTYR